MPLWRKLLTQIRESLDVNDMPDDFHRLLWSWLPLGLDREGRILDNAALVKAKTMPLREDISVERVQEALDWYADPDRGMIVRYSVNGRGYFYVPSFAREQGRRGREAASIYPAPPPSGQDQGTELVEDEVNDQLTDQIGPQNRTESEEKRIESEQNQNRRGTSSPTDRGAGLRRLSDLISCPSVSDADSDLARQTESGLPRQSESGLRPKRGPPVTDAARIERAIQIRERAERRKLPRREEAQMREWAYEYGAAALYEATRRTAFKKPDNFGGYLRKTLEQIGGV